METENYIINTNKLAQCPIDEHIAYFVTNKNSNKSWYSCDICDKFYEIHEVKKLNLKRENRI